MKAFSKKTKNELEQELYIEFDGNLYEMAKNYGRTYDEMHEIIFNKN